MARYKRAYEDRQSSVEVKVNSSFVREEFSKGISKGYYGDKFLEKICRRIIMELWRRDPALLENISTLAASKYGDYVKKTYGSVNFKKKLTDEYNKRREERIRQETERLIQEMQDDIMSEDSQKGFLDDTMFVNK